MQQESCCGTSLYFVTENLQEGDNPILINGIPVLMDNPTQVRAETVTLTTDDGELIIQDDSPSCCS